MRRAVARGRVFPQSYSTDRRYGRLSLKAVALFPLLWVNADDQGRLIGDPEEIKYLCCPNVDHITKADIPGLLEELMSNKLILRYDSPNSPVIQILDWWDQHRAPQWAWPSDYLPSDGWKDHLRYKSDSKTVVTLNWPLSGPPPAEGSPGVQVSTPEASGEDSGEEPAEPLSPSPDPSLNPNKEKDNGYWKRRGRGNSPERSGENSSPSPERLTARGLEVYELLKRNYKTRWAVVRATDPLTPVPRSLGAKDNAQLRDLAAELAAAGDCEEAVIRQAFDEAGTQSKFSVSYVRAILMAWLGRPHERAP
jgi:hypothetical protein